MATGNTLELARKLGISTPRVSQLKQQGRFDGSWTTNGRVIVWDLDRAEQQYNKENPGLAVLQIETGQSTTRLKSSELDIPTFNESKAKSEHFRAELARLDLEVKEEQLVEASRVKREAFTAARGVRDSLNNIPDRVSNQIAAESDPVVIHQLLTEEIRRALEALTSKEVA